MPTITAKKREHALLLLRHSNVSRLSAEQQLVYAVGLVIADEDGHVDSEELVTAAADDGTCSIARELLRRALR